MPFSCPDCGKPFPCVSGLNQHKRRTACGRPVEGPRQSRRRRSQVIPHNVTDPDWNNQASGDSKHCNDKGPAWFSGGHLGECAMKRTDRAGQALAPQVQPQQPPTPTLFPSSRKSIAPISLPPFLLCPKAWRWCVTARRTAPHAAPARPHSHPHPNRLSAQSPASSAATPGVAARATVVERPVLCHSLLIVCVCAFAPLCPPPKRRL